MTKLARERGEWAGVPMPLQGERLVIHPSYPWAKALGNVNAMDEQAGDGKPADYTVRNTFWSSRHRCVIVVFQEANGRVTKGVIPAVHSLDKQLRTLGAADAWGVDQEQAALATLRSLVNGRQYRQYLLTGTFLESSRRSGLTYLFRKLRPTVALAAEKGESRVRACLCMHPIAHYAGSWGGAMCPTDDVIAHLMLMRGDEPMYWRRSTQHPAYRPEAGL